MPIDCQTSGTIDVARNQRLSSRSHRVAMQKLNDRRSPAIFFTSLTSVQKSSLPFRDNHPPRNLIEKFARLRPFTIIHSVLAIDPPLKSSPEFARLHPTSIKFAFLFFVFSNFRVFVIGLPLKFPENEITRRITKTRKNESTKKCSKIPALNFDRKVRATSTIHHNS